MFKKILPLNLIISLRMFGLFIVLPVLSIYALNMPNSSHTMVGIIIGLVIFAKHSDLHEIEGVVEWYINDTESLVIVKYDELLTDEERLREAIR